MKKTLRRSLSMALAVVMLLSLSVTAYATNDIGPKADFEPFTSEVAVVPERTAGNTELEEIDPSTLNVKKLGDDPALAGEDTLTAENLPFGLNDIVRVSIFLDEPGTLAAGYATQGVGTNTGAVSYRNTLRAQQRSVTASIEHLTGSKLDVKWNLTLAVNAISANVRYGDIDAIKAVPGVRSVELEKRYEPQRDEINTSVTTEEMIFATNAWAEGYTGAGSMVAIIDTGTNQDHVSFDPDAFEYSISKNDKNIDLLTQEKVAAVADQLNSKADPASAYKNSKIPYAYNYIDGGYTTDHDSDTQGEHGSHVSGIAAANRYVKKDGEFVDAATTVYAVGVAPDAQILTMKVFGKGGGAYDSDYMAAIEDAIVLGADAANLSLGSSNPGFAFAGEYQAVMDSLVDSGTVVSISAGNSYYWSANNNDSYGMIYSDDVSFHTGGSPGSFFNSLGVASAENIGITGTPILLNDGTPVFYTETQDENYPNVPMDTIAGEQGYILVTTAGSEAEEFGALAEVLKGKVGICSRGSSSFYEKANAAAGNGAIATIIYNNQPGSISMNLTGYTYPAPAVSITQAEGRMLMETGEQKTLNGVTYYEGTFTVSGPSEIDSITHSELKDTVISDFSSWGVPGSLTMKPEITAPGGTIWSVNGMTDDRYELMSGTSMAAPHVAGMAAVMGQYVDENGLAEKTGLNKRTLINSLLMSTAVPMQPGGSYLPILQQGAGLGNVFAASQAKSYILMADGANTGAADGKVKVELGQDAERTGSYTYSFTINNISDTALAYELNTEMFTQGIDDYGEYGAYLSNDTVPLSASVDYYWGVSEDTGRDVDKNGSTDALDAQAILDVVSGKLAEEEIDSTAADMDEDGNVTSYDAALLLNWLKRQGMSENADLVIPAGGSKTVTVSIQLNNLDALNADYVNGAYVEGFTYVTCVSETEDGAFEDVQHSIPILGFYGSWTDPSMFDRASVTGELYGTDPYPYFAGRTGNNANSVQIRYNNKAATAFTGNPYVVEEEYPADRLAISSSAKIAAIKYNLLRNAGTTGWIVTDENGALIESGDIQNNVIGPYYYVNGGAWYNTGTTTSKINAKVSDFGLKEGDEFTLSMFAIPEYYALVLDPDAKDGNFTAEEVVKLRGDGQLGDGAFFEYTFKVDDTKPEITATLSEDKSLVTVSASDDNYVAYVAAMDAGATNAFFETVPQQTQPGETCAVEIPVTEEMGVAFIVFVADYAGNERAYLIRIEDGPVVVDHHEEFYRLTDTLEAGKEYLVANVNAAGSGYVLNSQGTNYYTNSAAVTVLQDEDRGTYIPVDSVYDSSVWSTAEGVTFTNKADGGVLGYNSANNPFVSWANTAYADSFVYQDNLLLIADFAAYGYGMSFSGGYFMFAGATPVYLYEKTEYTWSEEVDTENVSSVTVTPAENLLILDTIPTVELTADVKPIFMDDLSVTWSSSDETVATVDANGVVTAVGVGEAVITATSNKTPEVSGTASVTVIDKQPMDANVFGQVAYGKDDIQFAAIDLNDMTVTKLGEAFSAFYGGCQSKDYVYGNDADNDFHRFQITEEGEFVYDSEYSFAINPSYALLDGTNMPDFSVVDGETTYDYSYELVGVSPMGYLEFFTDDGNLSYFDMAGDLGSKLVAICFAGFDQDEESGNYTFYYYALTEDGTMYFLAVYGDVSSGEADLSLEYGKIGALNVVPMGEDETAFSMTYAGALAEVDGFFLADNNTKAIYFVDLTVDPEATSLPESYDATFIGKLDGATNVSTLFDNYFDAAASPNSSVNTNHVAEMVAFSNPMKAVTIQLIETPDAAPETEFAAVEAEEPTAAEPGIEEVIVDIAEDEDLEVVDLVPGSLNAVRGNAPVVRRTSGTVRAEDSDESEIQAVGNSNLSINLVEDVAVTNGVYAVAYDTEKLTYSKAEVSADHVSVNEDVEKGVITIAFASEKAIQPGRTVAYITFAPACESSEVEVITLERNDELELSESFMVPVNAAGHPWGEPAWVWAEDYSTAEATFVCKTNEAHTVTVEAVVTSEKVDGKMVYTATAELDGKTYTDSKEAEIPVDTATIYGVSLSLKGQIDMNFYVIAPESAAKAVITYEKPNDDGSVNEITQEYALDHSQSYYNASTDQYKLVYPNIPAKEMTVKAVIRVFDADGNQLNLVHSKTGPVAGNAYSYCVADWGNTVLAPDSTYEDVYKDMAKALLNYGDAAQKHFGFNLDNPANPNGYLAEETAAVVANPDYDAVIPANAKTELGYVGTSLNLKGATDIWMYFDHEVKATDANGNALPVVKSGNYYRVVIGNVAARKLNNMFTIRIAEGGKTYEYKYCALSYANIQMASEDATAELKTLCKAMYLYNEAAIAALGK